MNEGRLLLIALVAFLILSPSLSADTRWYLRNQPDTTDGDIVAFSADASLGAGTSYVMFSREYVALSGNPLGRFLKSENFNLSAAGNYSLSFFYRSPNDAKAGIVEFFPDGEVQFEQLATVHPDGTVDFSADGPAGKVTDLSGGWRRVELASISYPGDGVGAVFLTGRDVEFTGISGPVEFGGRTLAIPLVLASLGILLVAVLTAVALKVALSKRRGKRGEDEKKEKKEALDEISKDVYSR